MTTLISARDAFRFHYGDNAIDCPFGSYPSHGGQWKASGQVKKEEKIIKKGERIRRKGVAISDMRVEIGNRVFLLRAK